MFNWLKGTYFWRADGEWVLSAGEYRDGEWRDVPVEELFPDTALLALRLTAEGVKVDSAGIEDGACRFTPVDRDLKLRIEARRIKRVLSRFYGSYKGRRIVWRFSCHMYG